MRDEVVESGDENTGIVRVGQPRVGQDLSLERGIDTDATARRETGREVDGHGELLSGVVRVKRSEATSADVNRGLGVSRLVV